jgi:hypothetical protein
MPDTTSESSHERPFALTEFEPLPWFSPAEKGS